jgi:deoxyribonuclease V
MHELLSIPKSAEDAIALQEKWQKKIYPRTNQENCVMSDSDIRIIVGLDISYPADPSLNWGVGCAVVWDYIENCEISHFFHRAEITFPYIPGLLAFREVFLYSELLAKISTPIDVLLCDGHGYWHPRHLGEAVQLGVALNLPSIGIAKQPLHPIANLNWKQIDRKKGAYCEIYDNEIVGTAMVLSDYCSPVFISEGYRMDLKAATKIALNSTKNHRQPEPLFLADKYSRKELEFKKD